MTLRAKEQLNQRPIGNIGKQIILVKAADQSYTTQTALQSDTDLTFAIGVNETWVVTYMLDVGAGLATTGFKMSIAVPSSPTAVNCSASLNPDVQTATNQVVKRSATASATLTFAQANLTGAASGQLEVAFWIANGANAGSVTLQFCQETSSGTAITFRKGSYLIAQQLVN